jgi:TolB-like protein/DNA-binding winged helix-turn-helix (wHTH) protein/Tfp pilus assembly protein PilF
LKVTRRDVYRFGPYEIRMDSREIFKSGTRLKLRPRAFQLLSVLMERAGSVVTREELRELLWPAETFVDFEHGLNTAINELRRALSDSASSPRYVETLPKLGYRLIVPVDKVSQAPKDEPVTKPQPPLVPAAPVPGVKSLRKTGALQPRLVWLAMAAGLLTFTLSVGAYWGLWRTPVRSEASGQSIRVAVLPFENLTGNAAQDYLSDGLTEEMISQLGRASPQPLEVIARTSVMRYKHTEKRIENIGRELDAGYILEGSVRRQADRVRISAQLIRTAGEARVWTHQYDRELSDLFTLETEIAREISDEILRALGNRTPASRSSLVSSAPRQSAAYDLYLKGLYFLNKREAADFWRAIDYFQQAIDQDPSYAAAFAGMADCYALVGGYSSESRSEYMVKARAAALRALELDPNLPEAHTALAVVIQNYDRDWQTAGNEYRRAIELNPSYATAHHWYAEHLGYLGRFEEAFRESERARQLDPLSLIIAADHGLLLLYSRQYDRALEVCRSIVEMDPTFGRGGGCLFRVYEAKGMFTDALARLERQQPLTPEHPWIWSERAYLYGRLGAAQHARRALNAALQNYRPAATDPAVFVKAYLGLEDKDHVFAWLEKAYAQHSNAMTMLKVDPIYDPLREDPRFQDLLRRSGLLLP